MPVQTFIKSAFPSVWALEVLCELRSRSPCGMQEHELIETMRASRLVVQRSLAGLEAAGLVDIDASGGIRYAPDSAELAALSAAAEALYARAPDLVRRLIVSATHPGVGDES